MNHKLGYLKICIMHNSLSLYRFIAFFLKRRGERREEEDLKEGGGCWGIGGVTIRIGNCEWRCFDAAVERNTL